MGFKKGQGGRPKGAINKRTAETIAAAEAGITPLDYMLSLLRDEQLDRDTRLDAAKSAAPYVHAKLANVDATVSGKDGGPIVFTWLPKQS